MKTDHPKEPTEETRRRILRRIIEQMVGRMVPKTRLPVPQDPIDWEDKAKQLYLGF